MRQSHIYLAIKECKEEYGDPVELSCDLLGVSRAAYYRWLSCKKCARELENEKIAEIMEQIHTGILTRVIAVSKTICCTTTS